LRRQQIFLSSGRALSVAGLVALSETVTQPQGPVQPAVGDPASAGGLD